MNAILLSRRQTLAGLSAATLALVPGRPAMANDADDTSRDMILNDPAAPQAGAAKGDVTIVAYLDYNCPYCKKSTPELDRLIAEDGKIRLVHKDWPILGLASVHGAKLALAAHYQRKYHQAHRSLMAIPGRRIDIETMTDAIKKSGVDMHRLAADLEKHDEDIRSLLKRNASQASDIGFRGTPAYLVGPFRVESSLDYDGFAAAVRDARARQAKR